MRAALSISPLVLDLVQNRQPGRAGERISGIGVAVLETARIEHRPDEALMRHHGAERRIAGPKTLRQGQDVGRDVPVIGARKRPVRPPPDITSSWIRSTPWRSQISRTARM
jgi:hypothetical protein